MIFLYDTPNLDIRLDCHVSAYIGGNMAERNLFTAIMYQIRNCFLSASRDTRVGGVQFVDALQ